mmetsp:Transcript_7672/g.12178  ORF Transcript_7672/g.12178 Transcript_7672/m.12178 type:complete len:399 (+) Transcript_7672:2-1198(+)
MIHRAHSPDWRTAIRNLVNADSGRDILSEGKCNEQFLRTVYKAMSPWGSHGVDQDDVDKAERIVAQHDPCSTREMKEQMSKGLRCIDIRGGMRVQIVNGTMYLKSLQPCYQSRGRSMIHLLFQAMQAGPQIPDVDFVINCGDHPLVPKGRKDKAMPPILSIATTKEHLDIAWPCFSFWNWPEAGIYSWPKQRLEMLESSRRFDFESGKVPQMFWRGSDNGKFVNKNGQVSGKRRPLVHKSEKLPQIINAHFTKSTSPLTLVPLRDHCRYKYLANVAGATYSARLKYLLLCGSLLFQVEDPHFEFYQPLLTANKHFLQIKSDFSDLEEKLNWANKNPEKAREVANNSKRFGEECLQICNVINYMRQVLTVYSSALNFKVTVKDGAQIIMSPSDIDTFFG